MYIYIYDHPGVDNTCLLNQNHPIKWSCLKVTYSIWYIPGCYLWIDYSNLTATSLEWLVLGKETLVILQQADSSCEISHPQKSNEQSLGSMVSDFAFLAIRLGSSREKNGRLLLWNWTHVQRRPWPGTLTWHYSIIPSYLIGFNGKNCMILPPVW